MVRHGEHYGVDIVARHHLAVIVVSFAVRVVVVFVDGVHGLFQRAFVQIAGGDDLTVLFGHEALCVARTHHAPADNANDDSIGGRRPPVLAERAGGNQSRGGNGGGRGPDKAPS